jgi:hypothetical protein
VIAALAVTPQQLLPRPDVRFALAENPGGVTRLRLSRDPYRVLENRQFVGPFGSYLYAFAQDGSVRVVSLERRRECDVNVDIDRNQQLMDPNHDCFPIGGYPRNVLARGPGLRPPTNDPTVGPALPVDIAFTHVNRGGTGFLLTSRGDVFQVGLGYYQLPNNPAPPPWTRFTACARIRWPGLPRPSAHRSATSARPAWHSPRGSPSTPPTLARSCNRTSRPAARATRPICFFPHPERVPGRQQVVVRWEGILPFTQRDSGKLTPNSEGPGGAGTLTDEAGNFCSSGVEEGDILAMVGCEEDRECEPMRNEVCYRPPPGHREPACRARWSPTRPGPGCVSPSSAAAAATRSRACCEPRWSCG